MPQQNGVVIQPVPKGAQLGRGPTRMGPSRRRLYEPKWSTKNIPAQAAQSTIFFREQQTVDRLSNVGQSGVINVHDSATVFKILLLPMLGTDEVDQIGFYNSALVELKIQKSNAYQLLAGTLQACVGMAGATSISYLGEPASRKATAIGEVDIGAGESFDVKMVYPGAIPTQNDQALTVMFESMFDEPVT